MAATTVGELNAILRLDKSHFDSGIGAAEGRFSRFGSTAKTLAKGVALGAGAAVLGAAVAGTKALLDFDTGMREVFTLMPDITDQARTAMQEDVLAFSKSAGIATGEVLPSLYQALSKGVPADNVFDFMEVASQAAIGGSVGLETAVDGITSTVNAFAASGITAREVSDQMFTAVRTGGTTFGELSDSLFNVSPIAADLGVKFGDVAAALAQITSKGVPTSVAATQLRQLFVELSKDGGKAADAFQELSGKTFTDFIHSGRDVADAMELMQEAAADSGKSLADMFGSVEAGAAALQLGGSNLGDFRGQLGEMEGSTGATVKAFEEMEDGLQRQWNRIKVNFNTWLTEMALGVEKWWKDNAPAVKRFLDPIIEQVGEFGSGLAIAWQIITQDQETYTKGWRDSVSPLARDTKEVYDKIAASNEKFKEGMGIFWQILIQDQETYTKEWEDSVSPVAVTTKEVYDSTVTETGKFKDRWGIVWQILSQDQATYTKEWEANVSGLELATKKGWDKVVEDTWTFKVGMGILWKIITQDQETNTKEWEANASERALLTKKINDSTVTELGKYGDRWGEAWDTIRSAAETSGNLIVGGMSVRSAAMSTIWNWIKGELSRFKERWNETWEQIASGVRSAFSGVTGFVSGIIDRVIGSATRALNSAIGLINRAISTYNSIPIVPDISTISQVASPSGVGGKPNSNFARLHTGGRVPGPPGTDQMAMLRAGETVGRSGLGDSGTWPSEMRLILGDDQGDDLAEFMMDRGVHLIRSSQGLTT